MKRHKKAKAKPSASRVKRSPLITVLVVIGIVAVAAITVVSRQVGSAPQKTVQTATPAADVAGKKFVTVKVAGQEVQIDGQTGQIKPLTQDEARRLAEGLKKRLNKSSDGLKEVEQADGSVSVDLEGRFENVAVARVNQDGSVTQSCVDNPGAAATFFGIDPRLLGVDKANTAPLKSPKPTSGARAIK